MQASPLDVVPLGEVTHTAVQSGLWNHPSTWDNGVPSSGAKVYIPSRKVVTINQVISTRLKWIRLEGKLEFSKTNNTQLKVESLIGTVTSEVEIGSNIEPVASQVLAQIIFIDEGPLDLIQDFGQFGKGWVMMGKTRVFGAPKLSWTSLEIAPKAGDTFLELTEAPVGWVVGDQIVVTGTQIDQIESDEKRTVTGIEGKKILLNAPLSLDHIPPPGYDLKVHVANLSRNVIFQSENSEITRRGHLMFMHNLDVQMEYVRMYQMGRTNKRVQVDDWFFPTLIADDFEPGDRTNIRGRYSCHFHRGGVDPNVTQPALVKGCVVEDDPGWAYVNHSSNVDFIDNVSYNVVGGAFQTESGDEIGSFIENIAIRTVNPDYPILDPETVGVDIRESSQDFAFQGDAFWFHGGGVFIQGNVASGSSGHGFIFWTEGQREVGTEFDLQNMFKVANIPNGDLLPGLENIQSWWIPIREFNDNIAYTSTNGFAAYYVHATLFEDITELSEAYLNTVHSTFENLTIWNVSKFGVELQNCERFTFKNLKIINERPPAVGGEGIRNWTTVSKETNWKNIHVKGFEIGMIPPMQGKVHICGGQFSNEIDFLLIPPQRDSRVPGEARDLRMEGIVFGVDANQYGILQETPIKMAGAETLEGEIGFLDPEFQQKFFLIPDKIIVNLRGLEEKRLYYLEQAGDYIPIKTSNIGLASGAYRDLIENKTNAQIYQATGLAFAGSLLPQQTFMHSYIEGGVYSEEDKAMKIPSCQFIQEPLYEANFYDDFDFMQCWESVSNAGMDNFNPASFGSCLYEECITNKKTFSGSYQEEDGSIHVGDTLEILSQHSGAGQMFFSAGLANTLKPPFEIQSGVEGLFRILPCPQQLTGQVLQEVITKGWEPMEINSEVSEAENQEVLLFPNPVQYGPITLNFKAARDPKESYDVTIVTMEGRTVWRAHGRIRDQVSWTIPTYFLEPGIYFLEFKLKSGWKTVKKLIKK